MPFRRDQVQRGVGISLLRDAALDRSHRAFDWTEALFSVHHFQVPRQMPPRLSISTPSHRLVQLELSPLTAVNETNATPPFDARLKFLLRVPFFFEIRSITFFGTCFTFDTHSLAMLAQIAELIDGNLPKLTKEPRLLISMDANRMCWW